MSGWFAMKHGVSRHPLLRGNAARMAIWVWLVDNAVYKDTEHDINGTTIIVKRGQVAVSQRRLAEDTGVGRQVVRTFLDRLQTERMINPDVTHGKTVVTLCNYEKYQAALKGYNPPPNPAVTHDQPTKEQINNIPVGTAEKSAAVDLKKIIFSEGLKYFESCGVPVSKARPIFGRWVKDHGEAIVIEAIGKSQREGAVDPISFMQGIFRHKKSIEPPEGKAHSPFGSIPEIC